MKDRKKDKRKKGNFEGENIFRIILKKKAMYKFNIFTHTVRRLINDKLVLAEATRFNSLH